MTEGRKAEAAAAPDEYEALEPAPRHKPIVVRGEAIAIEPIKMSQLAAFSRALRPVVSDPATQRLLGAKNAGASSYMEWVETHSTELIDAVAVAIRKDTAWVENCDPAEFLQLTMAVFAANLDFFAHRLLPVWQQATDTVAATLDEKAGSTRSKA